jgi:hypothetical protein
MAEWLSRQSSARRLLWNLYGQAFAALGGIGLSWSASGKGVQFLRVFPLAVLLVLSKITQQHE